jgi:transcriptional regulator with XRE-family HTH domain
VTFFDTILVPKTSQIHQKIATKIRDIRKAKDITQEKLALKVDLNRAYIGYIERGERKPSVDTLAKIARGLGIELYELFKFN